MFTQTNRSFIATLSSMIFRILSRFEQNVSEWFSLPCFDTENEHQFWQQLQTEPIKTSKAPIIIGAIYFMAIITLAIFTNDFLNIEGITYYLIAPIIIILFLKFLRKTKINHFSKLPAIIWLVSPVSYTHLTLPTNREV